MKLFSNGNKNLAKMSEEFLEIPLEIKGREIHSIYIFHRFCKVIENMKFCKI